MGAFSLLVLGLEFCIGRPEMLKAWKIKRVYALAVEQLDSRKVLGSETKLACPGHCKYFKLQEAQEHVARALSSALKLSCFVVSWLVWRGACNTGQRVW